jgi:hypothetical protein
MNKNKVMMRKTNCILRALGWTAISVMVGSFTAKAQQGPISMTLTGVQGSVTDIGVSGGVTDTFGPGSFYIGLYQFTINGIAANASTCNPLTTSDSLIPSSGLQVGQTFSSICLSPDGLLDWSEHTYDYDSFSQAAHSANPPWIGNDGIQNAAYLWQLFGDGRNLTGPQGGGLAMAMYAALYQSTGYGVLGNPGDFIPNFSDDPTAGGFYTSYLNYLTRYGPLSGPLGVSANAQVGYMLTPDPDQSGSGQEFIMLSPNTPQLTPVPEPTTLIAASMLLIPFGASALHIFRGRNRGLTF